jgi:CubicO group peptidase (beta-lactamase class C family)
VQAVDVLTIRQKKMSTRYPTIFMGLLALLMCRIALALGPASGETIYDVPKLNDASFDGKFAELRGRLLEVKTMCCARGLPWPLATAPPSVRLGWNDAGLLVSVTVHHPRPWEFDYIRHLFEGEAVEFFISPRKGSRDRYMLIISPGVDPRYPEPRHCFFADPSEETEKDLSDLTFQCAREKTEDGYQLTALLPWSNLHLTPTIGMELAFQVYVMEADAGARPTVAMWHPAGESYIDPNSAQRIRLSHTPGTPVLASAAAQDDTEHNTRTVRVVAQKEFAGKRFELRTSEIGAVFGTLLQQQTQSFAELSLPIGQECQITIDDANIPLVVLPAKEDLATVVSHKLECKFPSCVFATTEFPRPYVQGAQHYRIVEVTYYDADDRPVESAAAPGRYGAAVEIADSHGRITRRFRTLFRVPPMLGQWTANDDQLDSLPSMLFADPATVASIPVDAKAQRSLAFLRQPDALQNQDTAALAACLFARQQNQIHDDGPDDLRSLDRQWWVDLKRKLNGWDRQFPVAFRSPTPMSGTPSPFVHFDTCEKAGVDAERVKEIDRLCTSIVGDVGEPVSICLVRHGVVFFQHAYGRVDGRPFTIDDAGDIMSATKPLAGALMMEVLDKGAVQIDEPIDKIFSSFKGIPVKRSMTIRDLFDHLNGLTGDWGDQIHDTEEIVAGFYAAVDVGNYSYNELGFALGGKIIEAVTGEAFPQFARHHLLEPLGMNHTRVTNGGGHNATTSLDYAKFGQLLLNRGRYGSMRFFSEELFQQMLPASDGSNRRGMGLIWMPWQKYGFATGTFGHNAGNSSVLVVDPLHDLVVIIVSGGVRKDFASRADPFYQAIINSLL